MKSLGICGCKSYVLVLAAILSAVGNASGTIGNPAELLPADTLLFCSLQNVNALGEKIKQTSTYDLYRDPAMQAFMVSAEKNARKKIHELLEKAWQKIGLEEPPAQLPWPEGQVILALRLGLKAEQISGGETPMGPATATERKTPVPQVVLLAQMGANLEAAQQLAEQLGPKAVEAGAVPRTESIRGVEIHLLGDSPDDDEAFCYGFKGPVLIAGWHLDFVRQVILRLDRADLPTLATQTDCRSVLKTIIEDTDFVGYFNTKTGIELIKATIPPEQQEQARAVVSALGFDNVGGMGISMAVAPQPREDCRIRFFWALAEPRTGIPAILTPLSTKVSLNRMITRDTARFCVANYDLGRIYDNIAQIVMAIANRDINMLFQGFMMMVAPPDAQSQPPLDLRKDVMGQCTIPITVTSRIEEAAGSTQNVKTVIAIGVQDPTILDNALGRIHEAFIAKGNKDLRREFLNSNIYLLPAEMNAAPMFSAPVLPFPQPDATTKPAPTAFAVAGDYLVLGSLEDVEQSIRNIRRTDAESLSTDAMYQYAASRLPGQVGCFFYQNDRTLTEATWKAFKDAALQDASRRPASDQDDDDSFGFDLTSLRFGPGRILEQIKEICDFTTLPEFDAVKQHWGASVGHLVTTDQGIYGETISIKPPE